MAWGNLVPATAAFTTTNMLIPYEGGISTQFLQKIAENTGYNYNAMWQRWYDRLIISEDLTSEQEMDFDTGNIWTDYTIQAIVDKSSAIRAFTSDYEIYIDRSCRVITLTTNYQVLGYQRDAASGLDKMKFTIKTLAGGGLRIKNDIAATVNLTVYIARTRKISGTPV